MAGTYDEEIKSAKAYARKNNLTVVRSFSSDQEGGWRLFPLRANRDDERYSYTMYELEKRTDYIAGADSLTKCHMPIYSGYFEFTENITYAAIEAYAQRLAKIENYVSINIRQIPSKGQYALEFKYTYESGFEERSFDMFLNKQKDALYKVFGEGLARWEISPSYYKIK